MIEPGIYRHYKNNLYRVLFVATWADYERPQPDDDVLVYLDGTRVSAVCGHRKPPHVLMTVKWSGNPCHPHDETAVDAGDGVVIYVSLSEKGRLSARTEEEFAERLPSSTVITEMNGWTCEAGVVHPPLRFTRIGS